ncbi:MAG: diguanylate cyclase [Desulfobacterales bacterium]|jgi:diguanylate cyclase (GGDEF)-like protein
MAVKILVVEDDVDFSKTLVAFLDESGFETISAKSAEEAAEILKKKEMDLVLTDIKLPGADGIKLAKKIKKKYNLGVIVMTAYSSEYSFEDVIKNGANDLIIKPFKFKELLLRIKKVVKELSLLNDHEKMINDLKRLTIEDSLTGLYNSRYFYEQLDKEIKRSIRYLHPISLIFIDVDNLKEINDNYGHMIGDKILRLIAKRIKAFLRSNDSAYRFAGDEFTLILPETTAIEAKFVANRILSKFANESFVVNKFEVSKMTLSIGIAEYQMNEGNQQLVHRADMTMYEAKQQGGNRVIVSPAVKGTSNSDH